MKKSFLKLCLIVGIALSFSSCGPTAVVVRTRPEPPVYARPARPSSSHIWVEGEWIWRGNQYVYRQGYWAAPQRRHGLYVSGHWRAGNGGWYWVPGHWR